LQDYNFLEGEGLKKKSFMRGKRLEELLRYSG